MYESEKLWRDVDEYFVRELCPEDEALTAARTSSRDAGLPDHEVAANQGQILALICQMIGARRVLGSAPWPGTPPSGSPGLSVRRGA